MFAQIYKHLKNNGFDVYSIGQHEGICTNPYIVVKENDYFLLDDVKYIIKDLGNQNRLNIYFDMLVERC